MIANARSLLFVPADRPERFAKAAESGADLVCIDLEDAVAPAQRVAAREAVGAHLAATAAPHRTGLRINAWATRDALHDLLACHHWLDAGHPPAFVMLAKAEDAIELQRLAAHLPGVPLIALVESSAGLQQASAIASAHPQVQALMLGGADLAAELGCDMAWEPLLHARCALVAAAAGASIACVDVPFLAVADDEGAALETARAATLGFTAKAAIHPAQIAPIHSGFMPPAPDVARARRIVQAVAEAHLSGGNAAALQVDGRLVDRPVLLAAQRLLRRAGG